MRERVLKFIWCPRCQGDLAVVPVEQMHIPVSEEFRPRPSALPEDQTPFTNEIKEGFLLCRGCHHLFPISKHVPRLFIYIPARCKDFFERHRTLLEQYQREGWALPSGHPEPGEAVVQASFTTEWGDYDYNGVIWNLDYEARLALCLREIGLPPDSLAGKTFADIGCGSGVLTNLIASRLSMEAVGLDLSFAVDRAAQQFLHNPFVHFVQGSVFHLPLRRRLFDVGYSSGVLHCTYSTRLAFLSASQVTKPGGRFYVWLYSAERRGIQGAISIGANLVRSVVSRLPLSLQNICVYGLTPLFWAARSLLRSRLYGGPTFRYNWRQALHATRDIFTPRFAYHHTRAEVVSWFKEAGYGNIEALTGEKPSKVRSIPISVRGDFLAGIQRE